MRLLVGIGLIVAGLAVAAGGLLRAEAPTAQEIASPRSPMQVAAAAATTASPVVVTLPTKAPSPVHPPALAPAEGSKGQGEPGLVHKLQGELMRVGCFSGAVNGIWTAPTREAMKAFLEEVNARLPVEKPDTVLLALLHGHQGRVCGACLAGQQPSADGRCPPVAIVASLDGKATPQAPTVAELVPPPVVAPRQRQERRSARRGPPIEGRMGIGAGAIAGPPAVEPRPAKVAAADPNPSTRHAAEPRRERRAARHAGPRSRAYLRPMRPARYAYRPYRRSGGFLAGIFGF